MTDTKIPAKVSAADSIAGVMAIVGHVGKDSTNTQQNFKFRGIDAVMNAVGPALRQVGGFIKPDVLKSNYEHGLTAKGGATLEVKLRVRYSWFGTDGGEPITSVVQAEATDMSDKGTAKAMSVAYRTFLLQILSLPTDDPDPDSEYIDRGTVAAPAKTSTPRTPKGPTKASKDWWLLGSKATTAEELAAVFEECRVAGELSIVCDYDAEAGTANTFLRGMKAKKFADPAAPAPLEAVSPFVEESDPNAGDGIGWPVATIPRSEPTPDDAA
jgi:hypothetical protein